MSELRIELSYIEGLVLFNKFSKNPDSIAKHWIGCSKDGGNAYSIDGTNSIFRRNPSGTSTWIR